MLFHPAILASLVCSALMFLVAALVAGAGLTVLSGWDPGRADRRQLIRERRALLAESGAKLVLGCQLLSLFVFIATAQQLHSLFTGAMCAAGTLNASRFGYPALWMKMAAFLLTGLWLIAHRASPRAVAIGLVRFKYLFLLAVVGVLGAENLLQLRFFSDLDPEVLTSCCATIFTSGANGFGAELSALPVGPTRTAFLVAGALTILLGGRLLVGSGSALGFSVLTVVLGGFSLTALVTWLAPAFYELPNHHCPFCLLTAEQGYVGYFLYLSLAVGILAGCGSGLVRALRRTDPAEEIDPSSERRLCLVSLAGFMVFTVIALWPIVTKDLRLEVF